MAHGQVVVQKKQDDALSSPLPSLWMYSATMTVAGLLGAFLATRLASKAYLAILSKRDKTHYREPTLNDVCRRNPKLVDKATMSTTIAITDSSPFTFATLRPSGLYIFGVHGKFRSGKDTIANFIYDTFTKFAPPPPLIFRSGFATALKRLVLELLPSNCPFRIPSDLDSSDAKNKLLTSPMYGLGLDPTQFTATSLRGILCRVFGIEHRSLGTRCDVATKTLLDIFKSVADGEIATVGQLLQAIGTEFRLHVSPKFWIDALAADVIRFIQSHTQHLATTTTRAFVIFITDVRFANELTFVRETLPMLCEQLSPSLQPRHHTIIKVIRPLPPHVAETRDPNHPSETALDAYSDFNFVADNTGTLDETRKQVTKYLLDSLFACPPPFVDNTPHQVVLL